MRITSLIWRRCVCRTVILAALAGMVGPGLAHDWGPPFLGSQAMAAQPKPQPQIKVTIEGNRRIEVGTILAYMQLPTDRPITAEDLNTAVRRLYGTGLFNDVELIPGENQVVVQVVENPSISVIAFEGNKVLKDDDLEKIIQLRPRLPFTRSAAEADAQAIIETYRRTGRYAAEVEPVIIERSENRVDLVFEIREGKKATVKSVDFVGNERYGDGKLRGVINTRQSGLFSWLLSKDIYDPDKLELDKEELRRFYLQRGYADFTVLSATAELSPDREGFHITFTVDEGEKYTFGLMVVNIQAKGLDPEGFTALLPAKLEGKTYDASKVDDIADQLTDLAGERGFAFVQVQPRANKNTEDRIINITFDVAEGSRIFVERIDIEGNTRTLDRVIRREMELVEGDAFDTRKIRRSRTNIRGLDYFSKVDIETEPGSSSDRAVLKIKVAEKSTGSLTLGVGFSSSVGPVGNIALTERNFLGRGQIVNATVTAAGRTQVYNFNFTEPRFLDRDLLVGGRVFYLHDNRDNTSSFSVNSYGFGPRVGFPLSEDLDILLSHDFVHDDIKVDPTASAAIQADAGSHITSAVDYKLSYDKRNDPVEPTGGFLATFEQSFAGLGGDQRFVKSDGTVKTWVGLFNDKVVASAELDAGALFTFNNKDALITQRYFLGGNTFRGFAVDGLGPRDLTTNDALGGNYYTVGRLQVSFPIGLPEELGVYGGAFLDAGSLWGLDQTSFPGSNITDSADFRASAGALLFVSTPVGPLELTFAYPIAKQSYDKTEFFRLSIGTRF